MATFTYGTMPGVSSTSGGLSSATGSPVMNPPVSLASGSIQSLNLFLNASGSNSIYTNNGKVYPASVALNFIIKT